MNIATSITNSLITAACVFCAGSAAIHDLGIDTAAQFAMFGERREMPPQTAIRKPHTHSERTSFYQAVRDMHVSNQWSQHGDA